MALVARGLSRRLGSHPASSGRGALVWLFLSTWCIAPASAIQVTVSDPYHVVILFQPVTLPCTYQVASTLSVPIVIWKYKSFCRDRIADAFSPASVDNQINSQMATLNSGYNPYVTCDDSVRTVRVVATKQGNAVTLGDYYQGRRITITGNADLTFDQTAWGDGGVYYCSVVSAQDLGGNNEAYAELIVLVYVAGKAATSGAPSIYSPDTYAYFSATKTPPPPAMIPMAPVYNGYPGDFDRNSSVGGHSSQVPLLRDTDSSVTSEVRSGYRIQANQQDDSMRVLYYMEKELANFDPSRHGPPNGRVERALSEITSLHEDDSRSQPFRGPAFTPVRDKEWGRRSPRSPRRWEQESLAEQPGGGWGVRRPRAHSVDALDDRTRPGSPESERSPPSSGRRGRASAVPRSRSRDDLYYQDDSKDFPHAWGPHCAEFRSGGRPQADSGAPHARSRDPPEDGRRSGSPHYDRRQLEEALRRKGAGERRRACREDEDEAYCGSEPPPYTPYSETESQASRERRLRRNLAPSRESLVV
ncbi:lipolysis-stimulated lipoprotein receptor isoform X3 [Elephas maximus indicus]|uniref:lipolysis-stimulated lipoprotein receptor isoform X3 n=1 Tax=Elephas maximus indicus TaxID=99487 RepID=UPI002116E9BD|nr:lipolysis-stimulated lipoprotein receptor isoform X3 [Elephas maximus indicus]